MSTGRIEVAIWYTQSSDGFSSDGDAAQAELDRIKNAVKALSDYRKRNTLNFQLEKLDDFIRQLESLM